MKNSRKGGIKDAGKENKLHCNLVRDESKEKSSKLST